MLVSGRVKVFGPPKNKVLFTLKTSKNVGLGGALAFTPLKFNNSDLQKWRLEDVCLSYWGPVTFQGRAVKLREGKHKVPKGHQT